MSHKHGNLPGIKPTKNALELFAHSKKEENDEVKKMYQTSGPFMGIKERKGSIKKRDSLSKGKNQSYLEE